MSHHKPSLWKTQCHQETMHHFDFLFLSAEINRVKIRCWSALPVEVQRLPCNLYVASPNGGSLMHWESLGLVSENSVPEPDSVSPCPISFSVTNWRSRSQHQAFCFRKLIFTCFWYHIEQNAIYLNKLNWQKNYFKIQFPSHTLEGERQSMIS